MESSAALSRFARSALRAGLLLFFALPGSLAWTQEAPYFVTYDHHLEEPGNLEIETSSTTGIPRSGQQLFIAPYAEIEYGVTGRWTSELYLEWQATPGDSAVFTGWRIENRFRPFQREHGINPVLYLEYESVNEASRILKEIEGHAEISNESNAELSATHVHELEAKLILSTDVRDWNIAGNFIATKNFSESEGFEFGYALGVSRPLGLAARSKPCVFCPENFTAGAELYGGLGTSDGFGLRATSHYIGPTLGFKIPHGPRVSFSPNFGLNDNSMKVLYRFNVSYEFQQIFRSRSPAE